MSYTEFTNEISGYNFFSKRTGKQIYRFEMYLAGLTPSQCFDRFNTKIIVKQLTY